MVRRIDRGSIVGEIAARWPRSGRWRVARGARGWSERRDTGTRMDTDTDTGRIAALISYRCEIRWMYARLARSSAGGTSVSPGVSRLT